MCMYRLEATYIARFCYQSYIFFSKRLNLQNKIPQNPISISQYTGLATILQSWFCKEKNTVNLKTKSWSSEYKKNVHENVSKRNVTHHEVRYYDSFARNTTG